MAKRRKPFVEPSDPWAPALDHLRALDEKWRAKIDRIGPCRLTARPDRFGTLVRAIIGQQISSKAARAIDRKLREIGGEPHEPRRLMELGVEGLRGVGLSTMKARYVLNLAEAIETGAAPIDRVHEWEDAEIIKNLTSIKGIGPWTVEMFLIFCLNRPDVLSAGDLGIRMALKNHYELDELPTPRLCRELTEPARPYRTIAMWYLWEEFDGPNT
jgi:DNA-3-methyladenine glycosylase II